MLTIMQDTFRRVIFLSSPDCEKPVVGRERDGTYVGRVFDESELGVCRRVPKRDRTLCRACDEFPFLEEDNARVPVGIGSMG
jgi:hypothetical protein